ncbi:MAG: GxxExxY protein [Flavobacteriia bacterium]|nr:GxxExxY protein [Flavobacteriia bacterium]
MTTLTKKAINDLTYELVGAAIHVHKSLGPGLLESIYHECMKIELTDRGIQFDTELKVPIEFYDRQLETVLKCDLFVEKCIVIELKAIKELIPVNEAQLMTYMKLLNAPKGILINFNCFHLFKEGQKTYVNEYYRSLPES